jgi:phospholipid-binding lipoprotein MlaA
MPRQNLASVSSRVVAILAVAFLFAGCATPPEDDPKALAEFEDTNDPIEPFNRAMFEFNRTVDGLLFKPLAIMYRGVVPGPVREGVHDVLTNLRAPFVFINDALQGEGDRAGVTAGRFAINTTVGVLGIFDVAAEWGLEPHSEDFGQTFAVWGMPEGFYLVLPIFGPSNPRDGLGLLAEAVLDPVNYWARSEDIDELPLSRTLATGVDIRSRHLDTLDEIERTSLDFYAAIRSLYRQRRADEIRNSRPSAIEPVPGGISTTPNPAQQAESAALLD